MEFNKYQTPIDELVYNHVVEGKVHKVAFKDAPDEVKEEFMEHLSTIPLVQWLTSVDRPMVKDLPRDGKGRAIYDITKPPILVDTDYFRPTAIHFQRTGRMTDLRPNPNPNSAYCAWKNEEVRRIREGYLRESDGAYVSGYMYWYLNYCPIILTLQGENENIGFRTVDFPNFWEGVNWRYLGWELARSLGQYFFEISARGRSKSYCLSSSLSRGFVVGDVPQNGTHKTSTRGVILADQKEFLIKDGTLNKFEDMVDFQAQNTQFPRKRLKSSLGDMDWVMGYIDLNTGTKRGTGNEVLGVAIKDDPDKARGKRSSLFLLEEIGKFPNLANVIKVAEPSVKDGSVVFGLMVGVGTGGTEGNDFSGAMDLIYHPAGSNILALENVWDKSAQARGTSIFCFPAYVNRTGCMDKDGISDVTKALYELCWERYIAKHENPDPIQITRTKAENPITLQDAIMRRDGTKFPVAQITERIQEIDLNPNFYDSMYVGRLVQKGNGEVMFEPSADKPIRKFPTKDNKVAGAVEIKALPVKGPGGRPVSNRYIAALDPIDDDQSNTMSLVSCFVLDLWTDEIVAEWTGRLESADACYEVCRLLCIFYNAKINYENNKKGFYAYMKMKSCLHYLEEELEVIRAKSNMKVEKIGNKLYGTNASNPINEWGRDLLRDYMLKPVTRVKEGNDDEEVTIPNVMTWWNRALLEEARQWNPDGNFDRISAMGMLMLFREDKRAKFGEDFRGLKKAKPSESRANDPFFERNYPTKGVKKESFDRRYFPEVYEKVQWQ